MDIEKPKVNPTKEQILIRIMLSTSLFLLLIWIALMYARTNPLLTHIINLNSKYLMIIILVPIPLIILFAVWSINYDVKTIGFKQAFANYKLVQELKKQLLESGKC